MTLLALSVLLALVAAVWVIRPIVVHRAAPLGDLLPGHVIDADAGKQAALASLREIEYDYAAGKLDAADYQALRARLSREALRAIADADLVAGQAPTEPEVPAMRHRCGFVNPVGSRFCAGCGDRLE